VTSCIHIGTLLFFLTMTLKVALSSDTLMFTDKTIGRHNLEPEYIAPSKP
jgi:hypothetical protein